MKKFFILILQFMIMSILTFCESLFFYKMILMRIDSNETFWVKILLVSMIIMIINEAIVLLLNRYTKLQLSSGVVVVLSSAVSPFICNLFGALIGGYGIFEGVDYFALLLLTYCVIFWSLIGGIALHIARKNK